MIIIIFLSRKLVHQHPTLTMTLHCLMLNSAGCDKYVNTCTMNVDTSEIQTTMQEGTIKTQKKKKKQVEIWRLLCLFFAER